MMLQDVCHVMEAVHASKQTVNAHASTVNAHASTANASGPVDAL